MPPTAAAPAIDMSTRLGSVGLPSPVLTASGCAASGRELDEFFDITQVPYRSVVVGGGAIGCEFASTLADLGSQVTMLEALLAPEEKDEEVGA